jgi:outer membrane autotransporter protein
VAIGIGSVTAPVPITLNGGHIIGDIVDAAPASNHSPVTIGGNFTTQGSFTVSSVTVNSGVDFTISGGNAITMNHMPASTGGTFTIGVNNESGTGFGKIVVNGAGQGLNLTGATITVDYTGGALVNGDQFKIGTGNAAITGGPGGTLTAVADNSALWNFKIADGTVASTPTSNHDLFLFVSSNPNVQYNNSGNAHTVAVVQQLSGTSDPVLQQVVTNINTAPTNAALNQVAQALQPSVDRGTFASVQNFTGQTMDLTDSRLSSLQNSGGYSGISSGNGTANRRVWLQSFGQTASEGERNGIAGYRAATGGIAMGGDTSELLSDAVVGLAFSYGNSIVRSDDANLTRTDINSYQLTAYGSYDLGDQYFTRAMAAYAYNNADTSRRGVGGVSGLNADGNFNANQYNARAEAGRDFFFGNTMVTPTLLTDYTLYDANDYTETGAGGADLHVQQKNLQSLDVGIGVTVQQTFTLDNGSRLIPQINAGYRYDLIGDAVESTSNFTAGGADIASAGASPARGMVNIGAGLKYAVADDWDMKANYTYEYKSSYHDNSALLQATWKFN